MKTKFIKYLTLYIFLFSCKNSEMESVKINGSWSVIINDSIYMESLIENDNLYLFGFDYFLLGPKNIKLLNDSLYLFQDNSKTSYKLIKNNNNFKLIGKNEIMKFSRIDSKELKFKDVNNEETELEYKIDFYNRRNKLFNFQIIYDYDSLKNNENFEEIIEFKDL